MALPTLPTVPNDPYSGAPLAESALAQQAVTPGAPLLPDFQDVYLNRNQPAPEAESAPAPDPYAGAPVVEPESDPYAGAAPVTSVFGYDMEKLNATPIEVLKKDKREFNPVDFYAKNTDALLKDPAALEKVEAVFEERDKERMTPLGLVKSVTMAPINAVLNPADAAKKSVEIAKGGAEFVGTLLSGVKQVVATGAEVAGSLSEGDLKGASKGIAEAIAAADSAQQRWVTVVTDKVGPAFGIIPRGKTARERLAFDADFKRAELKAAEGNGQLARDLGTSQDELKSLGVTLDPGAIERLSVIEDPLFLVPVGSVVGVVGKSGKFLLGKATSPAAAEAFAKGINSAMERAAAWPVSKSGAVVEKAGELAATKGVAGAKALASPLKTAGIVGTAMSGDITALAASLGAPTALKYGGKALGAVGRGVQAAAPAVGRVASETAKGAAEGAVLAMPLFLGSNEEEREGLLGMIAGAGALRGGLSAGGVAKGFAERGERLAGRAAQDKLAKKVFEAVDQGPVKDSAAYGTDTALDAAHQEHSATLSRGEQSLLSTTREFFRDAGVEVYALDKDTFVRHVPNVAGASAAEGFFLSRGQKLNADGTRSPVLQVLLNKDTNGLGHELYHAFKSLDPQGATALEAHITKTWTPEEQAWLSDTYNSALNGGKPKSQWTVHLNEKQILEEAAAEVFGRVVNATDLSGVRPSITKRASTFASTVLEKMGYPLAGKNLPQGPGVSALGVRPGTAEVKVSQDFLTDITRRVREGTLGTAEPGAPLQPGSPAAISRRPSAPEPSTPPKTPAAPATPQPATPAPLPAAPVTPVPTPVVAPTAENIRVTPKEQADFAAERSKVTNADQALAAAVKSGDPAQVAHVTVINDSMANGHAVEVIHKGVIREGGPTPGKPVARGTRRAEQAEAYVAEAMGALPDSVREAHQKLFFGTRWLKAGKQLTARSLDKALANVKNAVDMSADKITLPYEVDAAGKLTEVGWSEVVQDLKDYWSNQDRGFRGDGQALTPETRTRDVGQSIPPQDPRGPAAIISTERTDFLNLVQGLNIPATVKGQKQGVIPGNVKGQLLAEAQGKKPAKPAGFTEADVQKATYKPIEGVGVRSIAEVNPLRNELRAKGAPVESLIEVTENINVKNIESVTPRPDVTGRGGSTDITRAGFSLKAPTEGFFLPSLPKESKEFKDWFRGSKVVEESGQPSTLFHGTGQDFQEFNTRRRQNSLGAYFTDSREFAVKHGGGRKIVREVNLKLENPRDLRGVAREEIAKELGFSPEVVREMETQGRAGPYKTLEFLDEKYGVVPRLKRAGYDGLIFDESGASTYVAFRPEQIRDSAPSGGSFSLKAPESAPEVARRLEEKRKAGIPITDIVRRQTQQEVERGIASGKSLAPGEAAGFFSVKNLEDAKKILEMTPEEWTAEVQTLKGGLTPEAYRLGLSLTDRADLATLRELQAKTEQQGKDLMAAGDFNAAMPTILKTQFFREAIEAAQGIGSAARGLKLLREFDGKAPPFSEPQSSFSPARSVEDGLDPVSMAAIRTKGGNVFTGSFHGEAYLNMADAVGRGEFKEALPAGFSSLTDLLDSVMGGEKIDFIEDGFVTTSGKFLNRKEAFEHGKKIGQLKAGYSEGTRASGRGIAEREGILESDEFNRGKSFSVSPSKEVRGVAEKAAKASGVKEYKPTEKILAVNEGLAKRLADFYEDAKSSPDDPAVKASYEALIDQTERQGQAILDEGYTIEPFTGKGEPYKSSAEMIADVRDNKHMFFLKTEGAFGEGAKPTDNPMLRPSKIAPGQVANDVFRWVHDFFGHAKEGYQFGPKGELNAWKSHSEMFTPEAQGALAAETLAQNSWVNFGKQLRDADGNVAKKGEKGFVPATERPFAEQKNIIIPEELISEAKGETSFSVRRKGDAKKKTMEQEVAETDFSKYNVPAAQKPKGDKPTGWVLPNGEFVPLDTDYHQSWLGENSDRINKEFGTDIPKAATIDDRQKALNKGFIRSREYNGKLTVELNQKFFKGAGKDAIEDLLTKHALDLDRVDLYLLNDKGQVVDQVAQRLFDAENPQAAALSMLERVNSEATASAKGPSAIQRARAMGGDSFSPKAIKEAAIKIGDRVFTGRLHFDAWESAFDAGAVSFSDERGFFSKKKVVDGFVTNEGEFLDRAEAENRAFQQKQISRDDLRGGLEASEFEEARAFQRARGGGSFSVSRHPDAVKDAAFRDPETGKVYEGRYHIAAYKKAHEAGLSEAQLDKLVDGFTTNKGDFLDRDQAFARAVEMKQLDPKDYEAQIKAYEDEEMAVFKDKTALETTLFSDVRKDQRTLADSAFSAKAKAPKAPAEREVGAGGQKFFPQGSPEFNAYVENKITKSKNFPEAFPLEFRKDKKGNYLAQWDGDALPAAKPYDLLGSDLAEKSGSPEEFRDALAEKLVKDYNEAKKNPEIAVGEHWYSIFREKVGKVLGDDTKLFAELLGATSPQQAVGPNFKDALGAYNQFKSGAYDAMIEKYREGKKKFAEGDLTEFTEETGKKGKKADYAAFMGWWQNKHNLLPTKANGKKFGMNSRAVMKVLDGSWLEGVEGPKTPNFTGNLSGTSFKATIDVWAMRALSRLAGEESGKPWRIQPANETGVSNPDFFFGQEAFQKAADDLGIKADALQAILWFAEKDRWEKNGWTGAAGKAKSDYNTLLDRTTKTPEGFLDLAPDEVKPKAKKVAAQLELSDIKGK